MMYPSNYNALLLMSLNSLVIVYVSVASFTLSSSSVVCGMLLLL